MDSILKLEDTGQTEKENRIQLLIHALIREYPKMDRKMLKVNNGKNRQILTNIFHVHWYCQAAQISRQKNLQMIALSTQKIPGSLKKNYLHFQM